jgi:hypothetical protein
LESDKIAEKKIVGLALSKFEEANRQAIADIPADTSIALTDPRSVDICGNIKFSG